MSQCAATLYVSSQNHSIIIPKTATKLGSWRQMVPKESLRMGKLRHFTHEKGTNQIQIKPFQSSDRHEENLY